MPCEASEGWEARIRSKLSIAGKQCDLIQTFSHPNLTLSDPISSAAVTGVGLGAVLATRHNTPLVRTAATSTASVLILVGCFASKMNAYQTNIHSHLDLFHSPTHATSPL